MDISEILIKFAINVVIIVKYVLELLIINVHYAYLTIHLTPIKIVSYVLIMNFMLIPKDIVNNVIPVVKLVVILALINVLYVKEINIY